MMTRRQMTQMKKIESPETLLEMAENEENLLEHRTDGTDAFDTLYIGCEKKPQSCSSGFSIIGIG